MTTTKEALEPCPLSHYVHAGLSAHKTGLDPRIVCLDCGLTLRALDWIKVYERWQSRSAPIAPVVDEDETGQCDACGATVPESELANRNANNSAGIEGTFCRACRGERD